MKSQFLTLITLLGLSATSAMADAPAGYYDAAQGKCGKQLLQALQPIVGPHTVVAYKNLYDVYETSDVHPDGTVWDMYSTQNWGTFATVTLCGNYSGVGDCINREHSMPKSWFANQSPMESDAFHIYPTDGRVNGQRSNFPYGECAGGSAITNGSVKALGRLGASTFPGYNGTVFEPDDEYKGDFARTYFYMAAAYNDRISTWSSDMLAGNNYPCFDTWAVNLLMKWHLQDPVSEKERRRNDAVYAWQQNRNPFIDNPELAQHIWGDKKTTPWTADTDPTPRFIAPVDGLTLNAGPVLTGASTTLPVALHGINITSGASVTIAGEGFSVAPASVDNASLLAGTTLTVTFAPVTTGVKTATLTVTAGSLTSTVTISGEGVDELPPAPLFPSISFYFEDGGLAFVSTVGEPSAVAEVEVETENIDSDINVTVAEPFQLSTDRTNWTRSLTLSPLADRFYLRMMASRAGEYRSSLTAATADGSYIYDDVEIEGLVREAGLPFLEDFEREIPEGSSHGYGALEYEGNMCRWMTENVYFQYGGDQSYPHSGSQAVRFNKSGSRTLTMADDKAGGVGTVSFWARPWRSDAADCTFALSISADHGLTWEKVGELTAKAAGEANQYTPLSLEVNRTGALRLRVEQTAGARAMLDDLQITDCGAGDAVTVSRADDLRRSWDAYCLDGRLVIANDGLSNVFNVYALDGTELFASKVYGSVKLALPAGLYVVTAGNSARRVLVK